MRAMRSDNSRTSTAARLPARRAAIRATLVLPVAMAMIAASAAAEPEKIRIAGSNTVGETLMPALISGFAQQRGLSLVRRPDPDDPEVETMEAVFGVDPVIEVTLERRGSSTAFKALIDEAADIGMASRQIKEGEAEALTAKGAPDPFAKESEHVIALDGLAVIVSPDNPLGAISLGDLGAIFSGKISDWSQLGLPAGPVALHARDDQSGTYDTFKSLVLKPSGASLSGSAERHVSNEEIVAAVRRNPRAIGFTTFAAASGVKVVSMSLSCGIVSRPDEFTVQAEEYPLSRRLYLYTRGDSGPVEARALIEYAASDAAQPIISGTGFVDQRVKIANPESAGERLINGMRAARSDEEKSEMRRFVEIARGAARLSPTYRFQPGGDLLDGKAFADAARLARWMQRPENRAKKVLLAGFADGSGSFSANKALTEKRAEAVRRAVLVQVAPGFDPARLVVDGFGPAAPIACDQDPGGAAANRRVEVWVLP